jgi:hypothetical protein
MTASLSPDTLVNYQHIPKVSVDRAGDQPIHPITSEELRTILRGSGPSTNHNTFQVATLLSY